MVPSPEASNGFELPVGCDESAWRRLREEWRLVWRIWRDRSSEREREFGILSQSGKQVPLHVHEHPPKPVLDVQVLQQPLPLGDGQLDVAGDEIAELSRESPYDSVAVAAHSNRIFRMLWKVTFIPQPQRTPPQRDC